MNKIALEKPAEKISIDSIDMMEIFSYEAYIQFMEDSVDCLIDGTSSY